MYCKWLCNIIGYFCRLCDVTEENIPLTLHGISLADLTTWEVTELRSELSSHDPLALIHHYFENMLESSTQRIHWKPS